MEDVKILVVDDEEVVLESCDRALASQGYCVSKAHNVNQALEKLKEDNYDVIVADIVMPKRGGIELLKIIKDEHPQVQVIMITGYYSIQTAVESIKLGAFVYAGVDLQLAQQLWLLPCAAVGHLFGLRLHERKLQAETASFFRVMGSSLLLVSLIGLVKVTVSG